MVHINDVIAKYFDPYPNLLSIDVEGLDIDILKSMNFHAYKPEVICVESITFSTTNEETRIAEEYVIRGIFDVGYQEYNSSIIVTSLENAAQFTASS